MPESECSYNNIVGGVFVEFFLEIDLKMFSPTLQTNIIIDFVKKHLLSIKGAQKDNSI